MARINWVAWKKQAYFEIVTSVIINVANIIIIIIISSSSSSSSSTIIIVLLSLFLSAFLKKYIFCHIEMNHYRIIGGYK